VTSTNLCPFLVADGTCFYLLVCWPLPLNHRVCSVASCVFDRGKSRRGKWTVTANVQEAPKVFAGMTNMSPEMSAPLPATLVDKRPWPPPLKDSNSLLTDTYLLCLHSGHPFSSGQIDALLRQPRPPPLLLDLMDPDGLLKSIPWPSLCESGSVVHLQNSLALVLAISFTIVQTLSVWQEVSGRALDSITLLPTLCSRASDGLYQLKTVISYTNSYKLLFSRDDQDTKSAAKGGVKKPYALGSDSVKMYLNCKNGGWPCRCDSDSSSDAVSPIDVRAPLFVKEGWKT